ncbi:MAG: glycosyltransferase [Fulvivirga sp.]|nr:glycosyltransferase [Fulvivirga sp.]
MIAVAVILFFYCILLLWLISGWLMTKKIKLNNFSPSQVYSVIIPFRNEINNLPELISSLKSIDFPKEKYEVLFIDDHSSDGSSTILEKENFEVHLSQGDGKKTALETGISLSKGDVILTTDADCVIKPQWIKYHALMHEQEGAKLVSGGVTFSKTHTWFEKFQQMEFASLIGSGAATLKWGFSTMCNGANLSFDKKTFNEVGGYSDNKNIPSGDDEFLMHKINQQTKKVKFIKHKEALVATKAQPSLKLFYHQRKRWASKWKTYKNWKNSLLAVLVLLFNVGIIAAYLFIFITGFSNNLILMLLIIKILLEGFFLFSVLRFLSQPFNLFIFILLQICYPFYAVMFGITANFGHYQWKDRKHKL